MSSPHTIDVLCVAIHEPARRQFATCKTLQLPTPCTIEPALSSAMAAVRIFAANDFPLLGRALSRTQDRSHFFSSHERQKNRAKAAMPRGMHVAPITNQLYSVGVGIPGFSDLDLIEVEVGHEHGIFPIFPPWVIGFQNSYDENPIMKVRSIWHTFIPKKTVESTQLGTKNRRLSRNRRVRSKL